MNLFFKSFVLLGILVVFGSNGIAQNGLTKKEQLAFDKREKHLKKQFEEAALSWPAKQLYIRSFKQDGQLEIWVRNAMSEPFSLFKIYNVCALSGKLGPKRREGDLQVPEGIYHLASIILIKVICFLLMLNQEEKFIYMVNVQL
jgi:murein L,D-transpeptidase YafK